MDFDDFYKQYNKHLQCELRQRLSNCSTEVIDYIPDLCQETWLYIWNVKMQRTDWSSKFAKYPKMVVRDAVSRTIRMYFVVKNAKKRIPVTNLLHISCGDFRELAPTEGVRRPCL